MVVLKAFVCSGIVPHWIDVWIGYTLRDLNSELFNYFKGFYGKEFLRLSPYEELTDDEQPYFLEDFWE